MSAELNQLTVSERPRYQRVLYFAGLAIGKWTLVNYSGDGRWLSQCQCGTWRVCRPSRFGDGTRGCMKCYRAYQCAQAQKNWERKHGSITLDPNRVRISEIQEAVCKRFAVDHKVLVSERRSNAIAFPRQIAMVLARELTNRSLPQIGKQFNRDHTTVIHALHAVRQRMNTHPEWADHYNALKAQLTSRQEAQ